MRMSAVRARERRRERPAVDFRLMQSERLCRVSKSGVGGGEEEAEDGGSMRRMAAP